MTPTCPEAPPRRRVASKVAKPREASKAKCTIHISVEASKRLGVYATMTDTDRSAVVEALIMEHLRRFVIQDRDRAKTADPAMEVVSAT